MGYYGSSYGSSYSSLAKSTSSFTGASLVWLVISVIVAIVGGILVYCLFLKKSNDGKFKGFAGWLYDFLSFKKLTIETILKVCYIISAIFVTLISFVFIAHQFFTFLMILVLGNLGLRISYELILMTILIWRNTTEINKKMKTDSKKETK